MSKPQYDAIVIGAGLGGLSCGSILAKTGLKTLVLEQSERIGGCCSTFEDQGFHFDVGASIVESSLAIDSVFERLGKKRADCVDLRSCDPLYSFRTPEGEVINLPNDTDKTYELFKKFSPNDAENWLKYVDYWREASEKGLTQYFHNDMQSWQGLVKMLVKAPSLLRYLPSLFSSYEELVKKWFSHPNILNIFGSQAYGAGLPPRLCPGLQAAVGRTEHDGVYYPMEGMISIPKGIMNAGVENGLEVKLDTEVSKVIVSNGKVYGVVLKDGTRLTSRVVVSNINAKRLYLDHIGEEHLPSRVIEGIKSYALSMAMPMIHLGIDTKPPFQAHHSIPLAPFQSMNEIWDNFFLKGKLPSKTICKVCWPTHIDPGLAPEGHHTLNIQTIAPYQLDHGSWDDRGEEFMEKGISYVESTLWPAIRNHIVYKKISTPVDIERQLLHPQGAMYDLPHDLASALIFRPANRSKSIEGLYLTGSSTHPGGGVPMVVTGAGITADLILQDMTKL